MSVSELEEEASRRWLDAALAGDFGSAWAASDQILQASIESSGRERWCRSLWDGCPIDNRHVVVRCWRGLGDAIHFIRYAPLVRAKAASLTVEAPSELLPLFERISGIDRLVELDQGHLKSEDYVEIESTELPYVFRTTLDSIPCQVPYVSIGGRALQRTTPNVKIGLCWCGGPFDSRRSIPLFKLAPLVGVPEAIFFQLQRGRAFEEAVGSPLGFQNPNDRSMDICATAALINSLDVIVSVDTMVAHLAGALGKKVYLLLHSEADWRWLRDRDDSPWYPTMNLLRQSRAGDWNSVVTGLVNLLMKMTRDDKNGKIDVS